MEKRFKRTIEQLDEIFAFVSGFVARHSLSEAIAFKLNLVIEEVFVNMIEHNPGSQSEVLIDLTRDGGRLVISMTDFDVEPFDITKAGEYGSDRPLEERPVGRLGIHLVRKMVDGISYQYRDRQSRITLIKDLGKANA